MGQIMRQEHFTRTKRAMSIERALIWAFQSECASIDFAEEASPDSYRSAVSATWLVAQRGAIGCEIDGGGYSNPAHDADMIASAVANLPPQHGGKSMAVQIASLARAGARPDPMVNARQRMVPRDWRNTKHGAFAATEVVETITYLHRGRRIQRHVIACPVTIRPTSQQIAAARRNWLDWVGALIWLQHELCTLGVLDHVELTDIFPPLTPWRKEG